MISDNLYNLKTSLRLKISFWLNPTQLLRPWVGVHWNVTEDNLYISTPASISTDKITKRSIASDTARVLDILGLFAPAILPAKVLLQSLWKLTLKWDDDVPVDTREKFQHWTLSFSIITNYSISRRMIQNDCAVVSRYLHGFSDASSTAYGTAVYMRILHEDTTISVS